MPYILSPIIRESFEAMWFEGAPYKREAIYDINSTDPKSPPVNYSAYTLKPHSLSHIEAPSHTLKDGKTIDEFYKKNQTQFFWGETLVVKLKGNSFIDHPSITGIKIWEVSLSEIKEAIFEASNCNDVPDRLLLTLDNLPKNKFALHDPNYVLILSQEAADYLVSHSNFSLYGTSWKSSDFKPGSKERPIHNTLFKQALIMECLDLDKVPAGYYFMSAFPLPLEGASESPVCPVLFTPEEIKITF